MTWRNIIELSSMSNNDERVFYSRRKITDEDVKALFSKSIYMADPLLVFSRELSTEEDSALDTTYHGDKLDEPKVWEYTAILDAFHRESARLVPLIHRLKMSPEDALCYIIGYMWYDCMSGGCSHASLAVYRMLLEHLNVNPDKDLYVGNPVKDFLKEIEKVPRLPFEGRLLETFGRILQLPGGQDTGHTPKEGPMSLESFELRHVIEIKNKGRWEPVLSKGGEPLGFATETEARGAVECLFSKRYLAQVEHTGEVTIRTALYGCPGPMLRSKNHDQKRQKAEKRA